MLDPILERYIERDLSVEQIVAEGYDEAVVRRVAGMVDRNEYKRRQAPPGVRITQRAFGRDRRLQPFKCRRDIGGHDGTRHRPAMSHHLEKTDGHIAKHRDVRIGRTGKRD